MVKIKIKLFSEIYDLEIQEFDGKVILHLPELQVHAADIEFFAALEKLKERINDNKS